MKRIAILVPHYLSPKWLAACVWQFKQYPFSIDHELIVCDNSPGHWSIKALTETELGDGVKVVSGDSDLPSHGQGYWKCWEAASKDCDFAFTAENDSFPTRHGWSEPWIKAVGEGYELVGPYMPMASGKYVHPAGACISRRALEQAKTWQEAHKNWSFCPGAAIAFGLSDQGYHAVVDGLTMLEKCPPLVSNSRYQEVLNWRRAEAWQEMRSFDEDTFQNYGQRTGITNWEPLPGKYAYLKIGYEAGQWLSYYCDSHGIKVKHADLHIEWMPGREGRQAAYSTVYGGFTHIWAGSSSLLQGLEQPVKDLKQQQAEHWFSQVPENIRKQIIDLEENHK